MFVYYFVHIEQPFVEVEASLLRMLPGLKGWAEEAYRDGEGLRARVGLRVPWRVAKRVEISVGEPVRGATSTWIPISWEATGLRSLFPRLDADLTVNEIAPSLTQVALRGLYEAPLGSVGRAIDRVLLHRIAEATVKDFLDKVAAEAARGCSNVEVITDEHR